MRRGDELQDDEPLKSRVGVRLNRNTAREHRRPEAKEGSAVDLLDKTGHTIRLTRLDSEVLADPVTRSLGVAVSTRRNRDPINAAALVTRASRAFFEIGRESARAAVPEPQQGPPPAVFRETASGLLRVVYRELVVRFGPGVSDKRRQAILKNYRLVVRRMNAFVPQQVVVYHPERKYSGEDLVRISNELTQLEEVVMVTPNFVSQYSRYIPPNILSQEWHLKNPGKDEALKGEDLNVTEAWKITTGKPDIVVAILDDGVDVDHPNLKPNIWKNPDPTAKDQIGRDFFLPNDHPDHFNPRPKKFQSPYDQMQGNDIHGTCCAGLVAAGGLNGGSVGVASKCRILPVKIFHADDLAPDERVADAIRYAAKHADILSCSWNGGESSDVRLALEDAGRGREGRGAAVFCAAGNGSGSPVGFPARDRNAIAVGASTDQAQRASYSNVGPELSVVAPSSGGVNAIFTTDVSIPNRGFNLGSAAQGGADGLHTNRFGGTSAATPLAAGVGALVLSKNPSLSRQDLKSLLERTAKKIGGGDGENGHSNEFGFGRVDAGKAVSGA
jgi:subtilisin family serine protease